MCSADKSQRTVARGELLRYPWISCPFTAGILRESDPLLFVLEELLHPGGRQGRVSATTGESKCVDAPF
jgi:hypothetical protein